MRNKLFGTLLTLAALAGITQATIQPAAAQASCRYGIYSSAPSEDSRWIESADGYRFQIPSNYSAFAFENGAIGILNPDAAQFYRCHIASGYRSDDLYFATVEKINGRIYDSAWPAFIQGFDYYQEASTVRYGEGALGQAWAMFYNYDGYMETDIVHAVENLPRGGAVHIQSAFYSEEDMAVVMRAFLTLEPI